MVVLANTLSAVAMVLRTVLDLYFWVVIVACILTWVNPDPYNPIVRTIRALTEPVFLKVRHWLPFTYTSGLDFSPIVVLLAIKLVENIIVQSLLQYAAGM
ncbi:MAG: YggT family protein [Desulfovibrio sp.]|nr:YggT family protein [Desulfovibrio sp.]